MATIIRERERIESVSFDLFFPVNGPGWGFGFPCDEHGKVSPLTSVGKENYEMCLALEAEGKVRRELRRFENHYWEPAVILCNHCKKEVELRSSWANSCPECGVEYNGSGQELAPREFWGEETGERF